MHKKLGRKLVLSRETLRHVAGSSSVGLPDSVVTCAFGCTFLRCPGEPTKPITRCHIQCDPVQTATGCQR